MALQAAFLNELATVRPPSCISDKLDCPGYQTLAQHEDAATEGPAAVGREQFVKQAREMFGRLRESSCQRCLFFFLLQAVEHAIPFDQIPDWMERPNIDLNGRTPLDAVQQGRYEEVFEALWLADHDPGPAS